MLPMGGHSHFKQVGGWEHSERVRKVDIRYLCDGCIPNPLGPILLKQSPGDLVRVRGATLTSSLQLRDNRNPPSMPPLPPYLVGSLILTNLWDGRQIMLCLVEVVARSKW